MKLKEDTAVKVPCAVGSATNHVIDRYVHYRAPICASEHERTEAQRSKKPKRFGDDQARELEKVGDLRYKNFARL